MPHADRQTEVAMRPAVLPRARHLARPSAVGSDVAHAGRTQDADGEVPKRREHPGGVGRAQLVAVLVLGPVAHPVDLV